jgi:hypothetical protein
MFASISGPLPSGAANIDEAADTLATGPGTTNGDLLAPADADGFEIRISRNSELEFAV